MTHNWDVIDMMQTDFRSEREPWLRDNAGEMPLVRSPSQEPLHLYERPGLGAGIGDWVDYLAERHPNAARFGCLGAVGTALVGSLAFLGATLNTQNHGQYMAYLAQRKGTQGTWYTSTPLEEAIRQELPGNANAKGEDASTVEMQVNAYRSDFLRRNSIINDILQKQKLGHDVDDIPESVDVEYVELDGVLGFGR